MIWTKEEKKQYMKEYYKKNKVRINKAKRKWEKENPLKHKEHFKKSYLKNKHKYHYKRDKKRYKEQIREEKRKYNSKPYNRIKNIARRKANYKINIKGILCFNCKKQQAEERHHEDYNKPYDVLLLCKSCHKELHLNKLNPKKQELGLKA